MESDFARSSCSLVDALGDSFHCDDDDDDMLMLVV